MAFTSQLWGLLMGRVASPSSLISSSATMETEGRCSSQGVKTLP